MTVRGSWAGVVALVVALAIAGCGGSRGSDTTCNDFRNMSTDDQKTAVSNALQDHGHSNPSPPDVDTALFSTKAYCLVHGGGDKIGGIFGAG